MTKTELLWIVSLIAGYIAAQMIADITAVKLVSMFGLVVPAGTFIYAVTFTLRDALHSRLGANAARLTIIAAGVLNVLMALYIVGTVALPYPAFWSGQSAYTQTLGIVWAIVLASIIAEVISELIDTEVYEAMETGPVWRRVLVSNLISVPVDSMIFATLAFMVFPLLTGGDPLSLPALGLMIAGQSLLKYTLATLVLPIVYLVK